MANRMTKKEYDEVKNESYAVIGFFADTLRRNYMYGPGLSLYAAQKDIKKCQHNNQFCILLTKEQAEVVSKYESKHYRISERISLQETLQVITELERV